MIYEMRRYRAMPGRLPALLKRFETRTLKIWDRMGIRQSGFWTNIIGPSNLDLFYILVWDSMEERQRKLSVAHDMSGLGSTRSVR